MADQPLVYVVDDDADVVQALAMLLHSDGYVVEGFCRAESFLSRPGPRRPACLILDLQLGTSSGLDLLAKIDRERLPVIFLTGHGTIPAAVKALRNGASEFLTKPVEAEVLLHAVARVLREVGERWEQHEADRKIRERYERLTPRERQIMSFIVSGFLNKQTAYELGISEITIRIHRVQIMRKMGAGSLAELIRSAVRLGIPERINPDANRRERELVS